MVETTPTPTFVMTESYFLLEFEIVTLDPPAQFGLIDHTFERDVGGQCGKPVVIRFGCALWPLDQQPLLGRGFAAPGIVMRRTHTPTRKPRAQRRVAAVSPRDRLPGVSVELKSQCLG